MLAAVGDKLHVHGRIVGQREQVAEIIEVRGAGGAPPYLVRYPDGHETVLVPGSDASVEHPADPADPADPAGPAGSATG